MMFPLTWPGKTDASTTRNFSTPLTLSSVSTTSPMAQVPIKWYCQHRGQLPTELPHSSHYRVSLPKSPQAYLRGDVIPHKLLPLLLPFQRRPLRRLHPPPQTLLQHLPPSNSIHPLDALGQDLDVHGVPEVSRIDARWLVGGGGGDVHGAAREGVFEADEEGDAVGACGGRGGEELRLVRACREVELAGDAWS